jgi:hypothetical protein
VKIVNREESAMSSSEPNLSAPGFSASSSAALLRSQVLEQAKNDPVPTRAQLSGRRRLVTLLVLFVPLSLFLALGGVRMAPRPSGLVIETALGSSILAILVALVALGRGRSMLGRPRIWLVSVVLLTPVLLFSWRALASSQYPDMMLEWSERPGLRCLLLSGLLSLAPLFGLLWLRRGSEPVKPHLTAAALGASVGAGSWVLVDLWCPVGYVPHLLLGHLAPLVFIIAVSAVVGGRILRLRRVGVRQGFGSRDES